MRLENLFKKDVTRNINGVIKVGQQDEESVHQELSEYIITKELDRYFNQVYDVYAASLASHTDKIGVWISGFFGSGKSHFLKILSYLLANRSALGESALSLFLPKVTDPTLEAAITRVVGFEIMTAPFVIAHWQVGELLKDTPLQDGERAAIYLTNALTGWAESEAGPAIPGYEALVEERSAATAIERERPILVVLGNPPFLGQLRRRTSRTAGTGPAAYTDTSALFLLRALERVRPGGTVARRS